MFIKSQLNSVFLLCFRFITSSLSGNNHAPFFPLSKDKGKVKENNLLFVSDGFFQKNKMEPQILRFLVITLSTWANFLSYETFALLGPSELILVWLFARWYQPKEQQIPWWWDLPAVPGMES